jgi:hypothetical protein
MPAKYLGLYMGRSVICSPYGLALVRYMSLLFAVDWLQFFLFATLLAFALVDVLLRARAHEYPITLWGYCGFLWESV